MTERGDARTEPIGIGGRRGHVAPVGDVPDARTGVGQDPVERVGGTERHEEHGGDQRQGERRGEASEATPPEPNEVDAAGRVALLGELTDG